MLFFNKDILSNKITWWDNEESNEEMWYYRNRLFMEMVLIAIMTKRGSLFDYIKNDINPE